MLKLLFCEIHDDIELFGQCLKHDKNLEFSS
jgi:hypothetical protein